MRIAALILGIIGGVIGLFASGAALFVGGIGAAVQSQGASQIISLGWAALFLSIIGIIGGAIAIAAPKFGGGMMLVAGIGGFISVSLAYIVAGPLLLIGGLLALFARKPKATSYSMPPAAEGSAPSIS